MINTRRKAIFSKKRNRWFHLPRSRALNKKSQKETTPGSKKINKVINAEVADQANIAPEFIKPMLAEVATKIFDDEDWVFEIKFDGYRTIAVINNKQVDLYSRNQLSFNEKFKPIQQELRKLKHSAVLDGEVVVEDNTGRSDFQLLQNYQKTGKGNIKYYVFDLLNLDGNDTRSLSLLERKELLKILIDKKFKNILYSEHIIKDGKAFFEVAVKNNYEGIIAKAAGSTYRTGTQEQGMAEDKKYPRRGSRHSRDHGTKRFEKIFWFYPSGTIQGKGT